MEFGGVREGTSGDKGEKPLLKWLLCTLLLFFVGSAVAAKAAKAPVKEQQQEENDKE